MASVDWQLRGSGSRCRMWTREWPTKLFRHKVLALLGRRGLLSQERIELLDSWRRSGFSVHNRVFVHPGDQREFEALVRYMMRPPVSLARLWLANFR